jgi:hypothetical protein
VAVLQATLAKRAMAALEYLICTTLRQFRAVPVGNTLRDFEVMAKYPTTIRRRRRVAVWWEKE